MDYAINGNLKTNLKSRVARDRSQVRRATCWPSLMGRLNRAVTWLRTVAQPGLFTFLQVISAALRMAPFSFGIVFCCILGCMSQNLCFHFGLFHFHLLQVGDEKVSGGDFKIQLNFTRLSFGIIFAIPWIIFMADRILFVQTVFPNQPVIPAQFCRLGASF